jgi:hypothetical protein
VRTPLAAHRALATPHQGENSAMQASVARRRALAAPHQGENSAMQASVARQAQKKSKNERC